jgi:hypothetical protein
VAAFNQINSENQEQKAEKKDCSNVVAKEYVVVKKTSIRKAPGF